jgi:hypothetical protein
MRHASLLQWSPHLIGDLGLFDDIDPSAQALSEAPVVTLLAGETLEPSRSGEPLLIIPIKGVLVVSHGETSTSFQPGALVGLAEVLLGTANQPSVRADTDAVLLLVDRSRLDHLVDLSAHFSHVLARALLGCHPGRGPSLEHAGANCPSLDDVVSADIGCVVLVRLINREAMKLCHGHVAVAHALEGLEGALRQSIRPLDLYMPLPSGEWLVGLDGDMMAASIVANRLISRASRVVIFGDMHTPLPHLQVIVGIAIPEQGTSLRETADRARDSALQAARVGAVVGGALT